MGEAAWKLEKDLNLTRHAWEQMSRRGLSPRTVRRAIDFGRVSHVRGATIYAVGKKEVERFAREGLDLRELEGIHVVTDDGTILTVYRNRDLGGLRPRRGPRRRGR